MCLNKKSKEANSSLPANLGASGLVRRIQTVSQTLTGWILYQSRTIGEAAKNERLSSEIEPTYFKENWIYRPILNSSSQLPLSGNNDISVENQIGDLISLEKIPQNSTLQKKFGRKDEKLLNSISLASGKQDVDPTTRKKSLNFSSSDLG